MTAPFTNPWAVALFNATLYGGMLAILIMPLQKICRKIPARWRFALWFLVLIRLSAIPLPESRFSLFNLLPASQTAAVTPTAPPPFALTPAVSDGGANVLQPAPDAINITITSPSPLVSPSPSPRVTSPSHLIATPSPHPILWQTWLLAAYLTGASCILLRHLAAHFALRHILRAATPTNEPALLRSLDQARASLNIRRSIPLLISDALPSPALVGFLRPRILLPHSILASLTPTDLHFIFLHECAHLKRRDVLVNYWLALLSIVHWFNPFFWMILPDLRADRELACDEHVLLHTADRASFGNALLKLIEQTAPARLFPGSVGIFETRSFFKRRIHMIARFRRTPSWLVIPTIGVVALVAASTLTTAVSCAADPQVTASATGSKGDDSKNVKVLMEKAHAFIDKQQYKEAADLYRQILAIDPKNDNAKLLLQYANDRLNYAMYTELVKDRAGTTLTGLPTVAAPLFTAPGNAVESPADKKIREKLEEHLKEISAQEQSLGKVISFLRDNTEIHNIDVHWVALKYLGITPETPVTIDLRDVPYRKVLTTILANLPAKPSLSYTISDGVLSISYGNDLQDAISAARRLTDLPAKSPADKKTRAILETNIREISAEQQSLEKVLNFFRDNANINLDVRWGALKDSGIDRNTPVTISLKDVSYRKALATIFANLPMNNYMDYTLTDGVLTISSTSDLHANTLNSVAAGATPSATQPAKSSNAISEADQKELEAAKVVLKDLDKKMQIISLTEEFIETRQRWARRVAKLELNLAVDQKAQTKVAEEFVVSAKAFRDAVKARKNLDADKVAISMAEAAVTEADAVLERVKAGQSTNDKLQ